MKILRKRSLATRKPILLKFQGKWTGQISEEELSRWEEIKRTFKRNVLLGGVDEGDKFGKVIAQLTAFTEGLHDIKTTLEGGIDQIGREPEQSATEPVPQTININGIETAIEKFESIHQALAQMQDKLQTGFTRGLKAANQPSSICHRFPVAPTELKVINRVPPAFMEVIRCQFALIQAWMKPFEDLPKAAKSEIGELTKALDDAF